MERLLELGPDHRRAFGPLGNCAWSELVVQDGRWRLLRHNSSVLQLPNGHADGASSSGRGLRVASAPAVAAAGPDGGPPPPVGDADAVL
jgi:probable phosphoglycerate mutase